MTDGVGNLDGGIHHSLQHIAGGNGRNLKQQRFGHMEYGPIVNIQNAVEFNDYGVFVETALVVITNAGQSSDASVTFQVLLIGQGVDDDGSGHSGGLPARLPIGGVLFGILGLAGRPGLTQLFGDIDSNLGRQTGSVQDGPGGNSGAVGQGFGRLPNQVSRLGGGPDELHQVADRAADKTRLREPFVVVGRTHIGGVAQGDAAAQQGGGIIAVVGPVQIDRAEYPHHGADDLPAVFGFKRLSELVEAITVNPSHVVLVFQHNGRPRRLAGDENVGDAGGIRKNPVVLFPNVPPSANGAFPDDGSDATVQLPFV